MYQWGRINPTRGFLTDETPVFSFFTSLRASIYRSVAISEFNWDCFVAIVPRNDILFFIDSCFHRACPFYSEFWLLFLTRYEFILVSGSLLLFFILILNFELWFYTLRFSFFAIYYILYTIFISSLSLSQYLP